VITLTNAVRSLHCNDSHYTTLHYTTLHYTTLLYSVYNATTKHDINRRVLAANFGRRKGWAGGIQALGGYNTPSTTGSSSTSSTSTTASSSSSSSSGSATLGMSEAYDKASVERNRLQQDVSCKLL
jgi:hypothetical protein